jgi:hypothetical protein
MNAEQSLRAASVALLCAAGVSVAMVAAALLVDGGQDAIRAIGGAAPQAAISPGAIRVALFLDTLLPLAYGAGFVLLAASLIAVQPVIATSAALLAIAGTGFDFAENAIVFTTVLGGEPLSFLAFSLLKYGLLALAIMLIGAAFSARSAFETLVLALMRFGTPASVALHMSGLGGEAAEAGFGLALLVNFALLAFFCRGRAGAE